MPSKSVSIATQRVVQPEGKTPGMYEVRAFNDAGQMVAQATGTTPPSAIQWPAGVYGTFRLQAARLANEGGYMAEPAAGTLTVEPTMVDVPASISIS